VKARSAWTLAALAAIVGITASWWALALLPMGTGTPEWLVRTRDVCFGTRPDGLPNAGGWILLIGEPLGLIAVLATVWGDALREGFAALLRRGAGQAALAGMGALVLAGTAAAAQRVATARGEPFATNTGDEAAGGIEEMDQPAPALRLVDQSGAVVDLEDFTGRTVVVTFAFGHCETVCPTIVRQLLTGREQLGTAAPALLIVTLDPWRDTPARLPSIAEAWALPAGAHVVSGDVEAVENTLTAWKVPRVRNGSTGDVIHPTVAYLVGPGGRVVSRFNGSAQGLVAAASLPGGRRDGAVGWLE